MMEIRRKGRAGMGSGFNHGQCGLIERGLSWDEMEEGIKHTDMWGRVFQAEITTIADSKQKHACVSKE